MKQRLVRVTLLFAIALLSLTGCASLNYKISNPATPDVQYDTTNNKTVLIKIEDARTNKEFHQKTANLKQVNIQLENVENPIAWLSQSLKNELTARGIPVTIVQEESPEKADLVLLIKKYEIVSRRVSGFSPWIATHSFYGELQVHDKTFKIISFFYGGKVPVWSMNEILDPCFNIPMSVVIKEIASKINRYALGYSMSTSKVEQLAATAKQSSEQKDQNTYISVLELGGSNNSTAMDTLIALSESEDPMTKSVALSSIGVLGAEGNFNFLKNKYEQNADLAKFMALKSIGDIGSSESISFLNQVKLGEDYMNMNGIKHCVDLYLDRP